MRVAKLTAALLTANLAIGTLGTSALKAENGRWPQRPVRVITPFGAGTANDITARHFADRLAKRWGQAVAIENRPGADTIVGVGGFVSANDDHTLLFAGAASLTVVPFMKDKLPYDPIATSFHLDGMQHDDRHCRYGIVEHPFARRSGFPRQG